MTHVNMREFDFPTHRGATSGLSAEQTLAQLAARLGQATNWLVS